jgi:hypothetical protein
MGFFGGGGAASNMGGATSSTAGTAGLVPAPAAGEESGLLRGDATFLKSQHLKGQGFYTGFTALGAYGQYQITNAAVGGNWIANDANFVLFYYPDTFEFNRIGFATQIWPSTQNVEFAVYSCDQKIPLFPKTRTAAETISIAASTTEVSLSSTWSGSGFFYIGIRFAGTHNTHQALGVYSNIGSGLTSFGLKDATYGLKGEGFAYIGIQNGQSSSLASSYTSSQSFIAMRTNTGAGPWMILRKA